MTGVQTCALPICKPDRGLEVQISNDDFLRTRPMCCLAEGAADAACPSRYDDDFVGNLHGTVARRPAVSLNNFKRLVNFLNLRNNTKIPLADIGETDEIPVKLILEVGKAHPDRFRDGRALRRANPSQLS